MKDKYPSLSRPFLFMEVEMETGKDLKEKIKEFSAVKKRVQKLHGQFVTVSYRSGWNEIRVRGRVDDVYNHIFTVRGQFKEAFSYADVYTGQVRLVEG